MGNLCTTFLLIKFHSFKLIHIFVEKFENEKYTLSEMEDKYIISTKA